MIQILKSGLYTTVQDLGRLGYRHVGVPVSGAMDRFHAGLANQLINNPKDAAVLEITLQGPKLLFERPTQIVLTGADLSPTLNQQTIKNNEVVSIAEGDVMAFGKRHYGARTYLAVAGGLQSPVVMHSRSYYPPLTTSAVVKETDSIPYSSTNPPREQSHAYLNVNQKHFDTPVLEVYKGPEYELLSEEEQRLLTTREFSIGVNNRMAYQLVESFENQLASQITSAVLPGTVQLTPSGTLIILMADGQTTGGYPRVLQLSPSSIDVLAQKIKGDSVGFQLLE